MANKIAADWDLDFLEFRREKSVETREARIIVRHHEGKRSQKSLGGNRSRKSLAKPGESLCLKWLEAQRRVAGKTGFNLVFAFFGFERARAINQTAAWLQKFSAVIEKPLLESGQFYEVFF